MILNAADPREPATSRRMMVGFGLVFACLTAAHIWLPGGSRWWPFLPYFGVGPVIVFGISIISASFRVSRSHEPLIATTRGVAIRNAIAPADAVIGLMPFLSVVTCVALDDWAHSDAADPLALPTAIALTALASVIAILVVLSGAVAWHGHPIELTVAGIRVQGLFYQRLIPWDALATDGPLRPPGRVGRVDLAVAHPDRVQQRGWAAGTGTRELPLLAVGRPAYFLAEAIRWYVAAPAERSGINTPVGRERLAAHLTAVAAQAYRPLVHGPTGAVPTIRVPVPVRHPRATRLFVYLVVGAGLLVGAANLLVTIVFGDDIRAGEQTLLDDMPLPAEGTLLLGNDPVASARTVAVVALVVTALVSVAMLALTPATIRGSEPARVGLAIILGVVGCLTACPCDWSGVMEGPGTSMLLDAWVLLHMLANFAISVLAWTAFGLALTRAQPRT